MLSCSCSVQMKMIGKSVHLQDMLLDKCKFLSETLGRGGFYIFQGTLWLCFARLSSYSVLGSSGVGMDLAEVYE